MINSTKYSLILLFTLSIVSHTAHGQYVQPERDDTVRLFANTPFDTIEARKALAEGNATITGLAFTKPKSGGIIKYADPTAKKIKGNKIEILLFPVTPYLLEYLEVKKKENPKKLKFAYIHPDAWRYKLVAITNSEGEFTFPKMLPGKYYLEAILPWYQTQSYDEYKGSGYGNYGGRTDYYDRKYYNQYHYDKLTEFVEVKNDGEIVKVKLK